MPPRKKIALFSNALTLGGIGKVMLNLALGLREDGIDVEIVVSKGEGEYVRLFEQHHIPVVDLRCKHRNAFSALRLSRYIKEHRPDAVIAMGGFRNFIAIVARHLPGGRKTRLIISEHVGYSYVTLNPKSSFLRKTCIILGYRILTPILYRFADVTVAISHEVATSLAQMAWLRRDQIKVIYNPVVTPDLLKLAQIPAEHVWLQEKQAKVVLAVGRLHPMKDFPSLIKAFHRVHQKMACKLIILGDGAQRQKLLSLIDALGIKDDVDIVGFVENPYAYMCQADLLVSSSEFEVLPTGIIEAMACGCQIVATDCPYGGTREILREGRDGTLAPVGDVSALAAAIENVLTGNHLVSDEQLRQRGQYFSLSRAVAAYKALLGDTQQ